MPQVDLLPLQYWKIGIRRISETIQEICWVFFLLSLSQELIGVMADFEKSLFCIPGII